MFRGTELDRYADLIGRLENSRAKNRRGSGVRRSDPAREAKQQKRQAEYSANQNRYRGDFELEGDPFSMRQAVVVGWHNPETGATWSAPNPGYKPKEGTGWVKGYGPNFSSSKSAPTSPNLGRPPGGVYPPGEWQTIDRPMDRILQEDGRPTVSTSNKGKDFEAMLRARMSKF